MGNVIEVTLEGAGGTRDYEKLKNKPMLQFGEGAPVEIIGTVALPEIPVMEPISNADICQTFREVFK